MILNINKVEAELLRDAVLLWKQMLTSEGSYPAHKAAGKFVSRRCDDVVAKLDALIAAPTA